MSIPVLWKYQKDIAPVAVNFTDRFPSGATSLGSLAVTVKDDVGANVTGTMLASSAVFGNYAIPYIQGGTVGKRYTVSVFQTFDNGRTLNEFVYLDILNPRLQKQNEFFKYPLDKFDITVDWRKIQPIRATQLETLSIIIFDSLDVDVTNQFLTGVQVIDTISVGQIFGGGGGNSYLVELAQAFDDGTLFHDYLNMEVRAAIA